MKKIILTFLILLTSSASYAECNVKDVGLNKNFSELKDKYKMNEDFLDEEKFYKNIRGVDICPSLKDAEVSLLFLKNKLAKIFIYRKSSESVLLTISSNSFGEPDKLPNKDDPELKSYSTYWDLADNVSAYSFNISNNGYVEKLTMQSKNFDEEFEKLARKSEVNSNLDEGK